MDVNPERGDELFSNKSMSLPGGDFVRVGLTGGIATGKSTVAEIFREAGARIIDADRIAHAVIRKESPAWQAIRRCFGPGICTPDGEIDRGRLGNLVFRDQALRETLNRIVHPHVHAAIQAERQRLRRQEPAALIIEDIPLLIETGRAPDFDQIILVYAPESTQLDRLMARNHLARPDALARVRSQMPIEEKRTYASEIIDNSGPLSATRKQVADTYNRLKRLG